MRAALLVLATVVLLAGSVAGCGDVEDEREPIAMPEGRACQAVPPERVESMLGVRFEVSASAQIEDTYSCVLTLDEAPLPDLTFSMAATTADEVIFTTTVVPSFATPVTELGRIAYQVTVAPGTAADGSPTGPAVEIGWLSATPRLMLLRYTGAVGATDADVAALAPGLLDLARAIEQASLVGPTLG